MIGSIRSLGSGLANLSLAGLWRLVRDPGRSLAPLTAPPASAIADAARFLSPEKPRDVVERFRVQFGSHPFFAELDGRLFEKRRRRLHTRTGGSCSTWR